MSTSNMDLLEQRIARLEEELSGLTKSSGDPNARASRHLRTLKRFGMVVAATVFCSVAVAGAFFHDAGKPLDQYIQYESSVSFPPLDSLATWGRTDADGAGKQGYTTELLSLIADGAQTDSFQWPLYVELRGTTSPSATLPTSQSVGSTVRSVVRSTGSPWTVGFHSELAHGETVWTTGTPIATNGTSILFNGEMRSFSTGGVTTGVNLQCIYQDSTSQYCDNGINIQTGAASTPWQNGIHFDTNGTYINGNIGINFDQAQYNMGIDLENNSMRINAGQKIILEKYGTVYIWYNPTSGRVEIVRNGVVVGSF